MDGRVQRAVYDWVTASAGVDYVDTVTEPGPDRILAGESSPLIDSIHNRVRVSVEEHGSRFVAVVSHGDCAGNPVSKAEHLTHLNAALDRVASWDFPVTIVGLWIDSGRWQVEQVDLRQPAGIRARDS
jgi:hypothetical protein